MIRAVVIDDEIWARDTIIAMGKKLIPDFDVVAEADSVYAGYKSILKYNPDLVLLDIHLPDGMGFDLLKRFEAPLSFKVVFITAYEEYAIKAFQFSALDYILKPIDPEGFVKAILRVKHQMSLETFNAGLRNLIGFYTREGMPEDSKQIVIRTSSVVARFNTHEILRIECQSNYSFITLIMGAVYRTTKSLNALESLIGCSHFLRVHQTHLVNGRYMKLYLPAESVVLLADSSRIPVSVRKRQLVLDYFDKQ